MRAIEKLKRPLQLKPPKVTQATPCALELSTMFNCWRALSVDASECASSAKALSQCMASKGRTTAQSSSVDEINKWLLKVKNHKHL
ncbi:hypothetical protein BC831DRAFT_455023 [Entophlyctis helioformis]|nr:hypothetical protein BC831DRAFT_455023 [Entophlyctis helioformis]